MAGMGRVLALDVGEKRIGVALSDPLQMIARPLTVIQHASRAADLAAVRALVSEHQVVLIVCGYPLSLDGSEGTQAKWVRRFAEELAQGGDAPLELWDESYSTVEAEQVMQTNRRASPRERRQWVDAVAAAVILQSYLDAHAPSE